MLSLQNNQGQAVEFLYSFLEVRDQDNNLLSSLSESFPQTLPPDGKNYQGTVEILGPLSDTVSRVSVQLASYPDEKVKLQLNGISLSAAGNI